MIKNAKPEEIDLYQICITSSAYLCTKASITARQQNESSQWAAAIEFLHDSQIYTKILSKKWNKNTTPI